MQQQKPQSQPNPPPTEQKPDEFKYIRLNIKYHKMFAQSVQVNPKESLAELKQYLCQSTIFHIYDNFHFESAGKTLPQYAQLDTIFTGDSDLDIVIDPYDERTSRHHLRRLQQLIRNPILWAVLNYKEKESKPKQQPSIIKEKDLNIQTILEPSFVSQLFSQPETTASKQIIHFVNTSGYNPPPSYRRLYGDFYYLHIRTLEGIDYQITANPRGFYINNSNVSYFDPNPHSSYGRVYSSLFDLICDISGKFKKSFDDILENSVLSEVERVALMSGYKNKSVWLQRNQPHQHKWNAIRMDPQAQVQNTGVKDWNEMFQTQAQLPSQSTLQRLNKSKMFYKIYTEFINTASAGAKALVEGRMAPLNPLDDKLQHIYIQNSIFYSIAQQTPFTFAQEKGIDATPTVSSVNSDLRNLHRLINLNVPQLHVLHMVLIQYRGYKIIAQCIIPGILTADQLQCSQYGSIDDGKTIADNKQFEALMEMVCDKLDIDSHIEFTDEKGQKKRIAGSIEIKGILGSDKRKYILDLMRLSPRDYNYIGTDYHTCLLRPELIELYRQSLHPQKSQIQIKRSFQTKINVNLQTGTDFVPNSQKDKQEEMLKTMSKFLRQVCIPKLIMSLATLDKKYMSDSRGLMKVLHKHGVNARYLGQVYAHKLANDNPQIKVALQRIIFAKSAKHLFRMAMRQTSPMQMSAMLARLLNCLFGTKAHLAILEQGKINDTKKQTVVEQASPNTKVKSSKKKKDKGDKQSANSKLSKNSEQDGQNGIQIKDSQYVNMKPSEVWQLLKKIARSRYSHQFSQSIDNFNAFTIPFNKMAALRDVCITIGLKIQQKEYPIFSKKETAEELPFKVQNILQLHTISKHIPLENQETLKIVEAADKQLAQLKIEEAIELYNTAVQYMVGLYGSLHRDIALVHHKIATIYYRLGDYDAAINCQNNCLEILRILYGEDNVDTIDSLSNIGLYHFSKGQKQKALYYLFKSLFLCNFSFGQSYPQSIVCYMNISSIYQHNRQFQLAIVCMMETLDRIIRVYGKDNIHTAVCYTSLANLHYEVGDLRQCIDYQQKSVNVLKNTLKQSDARLIDAINLLSYYRQAFNTKKQQEEMAIKKPAPTGSNSKKSSEQYQQRQTQQVDNSERAQLLKKLQQAKWQSRMGFHK